MDKERPITVKDIYKFHAAISESQLPASRARYEYLLTRKDQISDRIRSGSIVLNAASLVGVFTALSTEAIAKGAFGITVPDLAFSACCFIIGLIGGVLGIVFESYRLPNEAAEQFDRLSRQENYNGTLNQIFTPENEENFRARMEDLHALPPRDFGFSLPSSLSVNFAGGAWIAGMLLPLWKVGSLIEWFG